MKQSCYTKSRLAGEMASLQMVLMGRFCIFFLYKTVNYHMQAKGASRVKYKLKKELSRWYKVKGHKKSSLRSEGGFAAKIPQTLFVKNLDAI